MTTTMTNLTTLKDHAAEELRRALTSDEEARTEHLRAVAEDYVTARGFFYNRNGDPDWVGRSYAYRTWVREVTGSANVPQAELGTVQAAIRYHIGNVLRDRLSDEELAAHGLRKESPRERSVEKREHLSATVGLLTGGRMLDNKDDIAYAVDTLTRALRRVRLDTLDADDRAEARDALMRLAAEAVRRAD